MSFEFVQAFPVLASLDLEETITFYTEKLGFTLENNYGKYLVMHRGGFELHFWLCDDANIAQNTSCYVQIKGVDALYEEYKAAGVIHPNGALDDQPYGMRDFAILDSHGNLIRFGEVLT